MQPVIDMHVYIGSNPGIPQLPIPGGASEITVDMLRERQAALREDGYAARMLIMPASIQGNAQLPGWVAGNPDLFLGGVAQLNPRRLSDELRTPQSVQELERIVEQGNVVGFKLNTAMVATPINDPTVFPYAELAREHNLPLLVHCASMEDQGYTRPDQIQNLLIEVPGLTLVLLHYGGLNHDYIPAAVKLAQEHPNVYLNTSGLSGELNRVEATTGARRQGDHNPGKYQDIFLKTVGTIPDKVLYGSDFPFLTLGTEHPIDKLEDPALKHQVLYSNSLAVFNLQDFAHE